METIKLAEAFVRLEEQVLNLKHENEELKEALKLAISLLEKEGYNALGCELKELLK